MAKSAKPEIGGFAQGARKDGGDGLSRGSIIYRRARAFLVEMPYGLKLKPPQSPDDRYNVPRRSGGSRWQTSYQPSALLGHYAGRGASFVLPRPPLSVRRALGSVRDAEDVGPPAGRASVAL